MKKFYFFISEMRLNEQGQMRTVLRALPGQTTYEPETRGVTAVDTELPVQTDSESLGRICRAVLGTKWGIIVEGNTQHSTRLKVYHRDGSAFYRIDGCIPEGEFLNHEGMSEAYSLLTYPERPEPQEAAQPAATTTATSGLHVDETDIINANLTKGYNFVTALREHVSDDDDILAMSRLYDRLQNGVVAFRYLKNADGSERLAIGTRNPNIIRAYGAEPTSPREERGGFDGIHVGYFDLQRHAWRSFTSENFIGNAEDFDAPDVYIPQSVYMGHPDSNALIALLANNN